MAKSDKIVEVSKSEFSMSKLKGQDVYNLNLYRELTAMHNQSWGMRFVTEDDISGEYALISTGRTYHLHHLDRGIDLNLPKEKALQAMSGERLQIFQGEW